MPDRDLDGTTPSTGPSPLPQRLDPWPAKPRGVGSAQGIASNAQPRDRHAGLQRPFYPTVRLLPAE